MATDINKIKAMMAVAGGGDGGGKAATATPTTGTTSPVPKPVDDRLKTEWNGFIDFMKQKGLSGSPVLDARDKNMGQQYLNQYRQANPNVSLQYEDVPLIQKWLNDYRGSAWKQVQAGKATSDAKNFDEFMPNLSPSDGWLGSKTSQTIFPHRVMNGKVIGYTNIE